MMRVAQSLAFLLVCAYAAKMATVLLTRGTGTDRLTRRIILVTSILASFFGSFLLLGVAALFTGRSLVNVGSALVVNVMCAAALWLLQRRALSIDAERSAGRTAVRNRRTGIDLATGVAVLGVATFSLCGALLLAGFPRGYEVQAYHLPSAINILRTGTLQPWDTAFLHTYPLNASLYYAFLLQFVPEHLVSASDLVFLATLVFAVYATSRQIAGDRRAALLAATGIATVPLVAFSSFELGADVGGIACLALALYVACADTLPPARRAALAGVAAGLAYGFKSLHLVGGAIVLASLVLRPVREEEGRSGRTRLGVLAAFSAAWFLFAGFWLLRNWVLFHNPLYPVWMPLFGHWLGWLQPPDQDYGMRLASQFEWVRRPAEWAVYPWVEWQRIGENFKHSSGLGAFFAATFPVSLGAAIVTLLSRRQIVNRVAIATLCGGAVLILLVWWVLGDRQPRYAMGALVFVCPLVAWTIAGANGYARRLFDGVVALAIVLMLFMIGVHQLIDFGDRVVHGHGYERSRFYDYPVAIDSLPAGSTILNLADRPAQYPLTGIRFRNRVISLPEATRELTGKVALFALPGITLRHDVLRRLGVTHVFVAGTHLEWDGCLSLSEVPRSPQDASGGADRSKVPRLFAVHYCDDGRIANRLGRP